MISGLAILDADETGVWIRSRFSTECGPTIPTPCNTRDTFANTTVTGNVIQAKDTGVGFQPTNSGDVVEGAAVTDNAIHLRGDGYAAGIVALQGMTAGDDGTLSRISGVTIARNSIEGDAAMMGGVDLGSGANRSQVGLTEDAQVLDNRIHFADRGNLTPDHGIAVMAGSDTREAALPDLQPIKYPDGNVTRDVELAANEISGDMALGIWIGAGSGGSAGSENRVEDVDVTGNVIDTGRVGGGVSLTTGGADPAWAHYGTANQITNIAIARNRITTGLAHNPALALEMAGGIVLQGGAEYSRDGRVHDVRIRENTVKTQFDGVPAGINLIGGGWPGSHSEQNSVTCVPLVANQVTGTPSVVSVLSPGTNQASLGGCATTPDTTITSGPSGPINNPAPTFGFSSSDPAASFECRLDAANWAACTPPKTTSALHDGDHTFYVRAIDQAGYVDETPALRQFTVDTMVAGAKISAQRVQRQRNRVKVKVKAKAAERVSTKATGKVKLGHKKLKLKPQTKAIVAGKRATLTLKLKKRGADKKVMRTLKHHKKVKASINVELTDDAGNADTVKQVVRLK